MAIKKYYVTVDDLGNTRWYKDAKCKVLHRENGPAVECADGHKEWWQMANAIALTGLPLNGMMATKAGGKMANAIALTALLLSGLAAPKSGISMAKN